MEGSISIIEITDIQAPELDIFARLSETQLYHYYEPEKGIFIAESPNVIERALAAGYEPLSLLTGKKILEGALARMDASADAALLMAEQDGTGEEQDSDDGRSSVLAGILRSCGNIPVYTATDEVLSQMTGFQLTRGVLCAMRRKNLPSVSELLAGIRRVVVLDRVMNPTNVGAIFRSAAALNMDAVLLTKGCSDPLQKRAVRVSMGTVFQIPWTFFGEMQEQEGWLQELKKQGWTTIAMALRDDSISLDDPRLKQEEKLAVIMGTEGDGLSQAAIDGCDHTVKIPMTHGVDSLNVAAASAVAFWELGKREELS